MTALTLTAASSVNAAFEYLVEFSTDCVRRLAHESEYYNNGLNIYIYILVHMWIHIIYLIMALWRLMMAVVVVGLRCCAVISCPNVFYANTNLRRRRRCGSARDERAGVAVESFFLYVWGNEGELW